jgi:beta-N-acetylhexosaminidase
MILFSRDPEGDVTALEGALEDGRLTQERVDDAVLRILALKAALGLHRADKRSLAGRLAAIGITANAEVADRTTRRAPTLVKDTQNLLPLSPETHHRVLVITPGIIQPFQPPVPFAIPDLLRAEGFEVTLHEHSTAITPDDFDLVLYLFGEETLLTRGRIGIDWAALGGNLQAAMYRPWNDIPTAMISFGYPYLLYDAPRVPTYINAYATMESMQRAVVEALLGRLEWNRHNPVDPFCGLEDARY